MHIQRQFGRWLRFSKIMTTIKKSWGSLLEQTGTNKRKNKQTTKGEPLEFLLKPMSNIYSLLPWPHTQDNFDLTCTLFTQVLQNNSIFLLDLKSLYDYESVWCCHIVIPTLLSLLSKSGVDSLLSREGNIHHCFPLNGNVRQPNCQVGGILNFRLDQLRFNVYLT